MKRILLILAVLVLIAVGAVAACDVVERAAVERFYAANPLLREMRNMPPSTPRSGDPWPHFTEVLLRRVPVGSSYPEAMDILRSEGLDCNSSRMTERKIVCFPSSRPSLVPRWYIEVMFDPNDRVSGGRVLMLKATST